MKFTLAPYPAYKNSGVEWLGDVPEHWNVVPNRAIFDEVRDRDHPDEDMLSVTITKGILPQRALLSDTSKKDSSNQDKSAYKLVQSGDLAYNKMRAWQGAIGVSDFRGIISPAYVVMRLLGASNSRYFHYLFRIPQFAKEAESWSYGITSDMWSLRPEHFKLIYSCIPPLTEQIAIVRFLDYMDRRIRLYVGAKQKLIKLLEKQKQAIVHRAVTRGLDPDVRLKPSGIDWLGKVPAHWDVRRLRNTAEMRVSNVDKLTNDDEESVRLCNYVDVYKNDRINDQISFMRATATSDEVERFRLKIGDVLITKDSEAWNDIGIPSLVEYSASDLVCGYHLALLRPHDKLLMGGYGLYALRIPGIAYQFYVRANGVTRFGLSQNSIKDVIIPVPPLAEQAAIVKYLDNATANIDATINRAKQEISLLNEYRTSLIADVVTGKLDVRKVAARLPDKQIESELLDRDNAPVFDDEFEDSDADIDTELEEVET